MKTNKFFSAVFAALALVGLTACEPPTPAEPLELAESSITLKVGETHQLEANVKVESWTSSNDAVATVADGLVTAVSAGNAIISATAAGVTKTCVVLVEADQTQGTGATLKGSKFWPIAIDGTTADANASKMVADFRPDDVGKFLYIWENTYVANDNPTGLNFHGNTDGYTALVVGSIGWSGCGYCLTETDGSNAWQAAEELRAAIVANPDDYFLHMAIKSTDKASHCFYVFGSEATKFVLGSTSQYDGPVYKDFTRNGEWAEFDIPMAQYATALATTTCAAGVNVFVALSEGTAGAQLNMDAVYFYKK